jgi:hypothetical protein
MYLSDVQTLIKDNASNLDFVSWKQFNNVLVQYLNAGEETVIVQGADKECIVVCGYVFVGTSETTGESFFDRDPKFSLTMRHNY